MNEAMSEAAGNLAALLPHLLAHSLMAVGGIYVVLAELHRVVVQSGMMSDREFIDLFALAQAAPGPNSMFIALLGWRVAGVGGAVAAMAAFTLPAALVAGAVGQLWSSWGRARWFRALARGLAPVTVGLVLAGAVLLVQAAAASWVSLLVSAVAAALAGLSRLHPVAILAGAGAIGWATAP